MKRSNSAMLLLAGALLIAVAIITTIVTTSSVTTASAKPAEVSNKCAQTVHYAAYDAPKGSKDFGPDQHFDSVKDGSTRFMEKQCSDPLFAAIHTEALRLDKHVDKLDRSKTMALAARYVHDHKLWARDVKAFNSQVESMKLADYDAPYETLGMVPGSNRNDMPRLIKSSQKVKLGQSLDITLKSGVVLHDRTICDLQLSVPEFSVPKPKPTIHKTTTPKQHTPKKVHQTAPPKKVHHGCAYYGTCKPPAPPKMNCEDKLGPGYYGTYPNCTKSTVDKKGKSVIPDPAKSAPAKNPAPAEESSGGSSGGSDSGSGSSPKGPGSNMCYGSDGNPAEPGDPGADCGP